MRRRPAEFCRKEREIGRVEEKKERYKRDLVGRDRKRNELDRSHDRGAYVVERKFRKESFFHPWPRQLRPSGNMAPLRLPALHSTALHSCPVLPRYTHFYQPTGRCYDESSTTILLSGFIVLFDWLGCKSWKPARISKRRGFSARAFFLFPSTFARQ